ncbi:hypothetical protein PMAYCL1PPCAC_20202, partial [Pristionchus mayeri]
DRTEEAFEKLRQLTLDASGRSTISDKFNLVPAWTNDVNVPVPTINIQNVFATLIAVFQDVVQYSDVDYGKGLDHTVTKLCDIMEDEVKYPDPIDAVRYAQQWKYGNFENPETGSDPEADFAFMKDMTQYIDGHADPDGTRPYPDNALAGVLWSWLTCNELGYYQTTDYGYGIFGNPVPLNFQVTMCEKVFRGKMDHIEKGVARTNYQYGGRERFSATNVVLPNGNHDPWHAMGILEQGKLDESVVPILIEGTAHCADMYAAREQDSPQLMHARETILANIRKWLNGDTQPDTTTKKPLTPPQTDQTTDDETTTERATPPSTTTTVPTPTTTTSSSSALSVTVAMILVTAVV